MIFKREYTAKEPLTRYDTTGAIRYWLPEREEGVRINLCSGCGALYWLAKITARHRCQDIEATMSSTLLVCGSRTWHDWDCIDHVLDSYPRDTVIVHGDAPRGADHIAAAIATRLGFSDVRAHPADWGKYGKGAGPIRNTEMLDQEHPDTVIAFRVNGISRGTDDMIQQARSRGIFVTVYEQEDS